MHPAGERPISVGVAGATGYAGVELTRALSRHPHTRLRIAMGSSDRPSAASPRLNRIWDGEIEPFSVAALADADAVFLALPEAAAAEIVPPLLDRQVRVFDLSGAFRLRDAEARARWYPATPTDVAESAVYGLPEHYRDELRSARLVSCPGCYPTAALIALRPLVKAGLIDGHIIIDAKSGISGAGKAASERTHFSECHGSVAAYGVMNHRHGQEIEQELDRPVTFVPHLVPLDRGILETIYATVAPSVDESSIANTLGSAYQDAPFVRLTGSRLPEIKHVAFTNFCDVGWVLDIDTRRLVMVAVIDNLLKGAAGQAIQSFNVAYGFDETAGIE